MAEIVQDGADHGAHAPAWATAWVPAARLAWLLWVLIAGCAGLTTLLVAGSRTAPRPDWQPVAFRTGEGALADIARHAQVDRCRLGMTVRDSMLVLAIEDNGRGRDGAPEGAGITGMRELCAQIGATLHITTPRGGGTRVEACLPLADHSAKAGNGPVPDAGNRS
ncbi:hypothetical protein ABZ915_46780 [Streptomyces sp. NPDC046915]|uniref:sensor histidine kinase n=1 Tax=Streptomyces sp. NPDC046915 TaxID=3155257 RepID=UPI0033DC7572